MYLSPDISNMQKSIFLPFLLIFVSKLKIFHLNRRLFPSKCNLLHYQFTSHLKRRNIFPVLILDSVFEKLRFLFSLSRLLEVISHSIVEEYLFVFEDLQHL